MKRVLFALCVGAAALALAPSAPMAQQKASSVKAGKGEKVCRGIKGRARLFAPLDVPEDLGVLLEQVWASTAAPRFSDDGFRTTLDQRRTALLNRDSGSFERTSSLALRTSPPNFLSFGQPGGLP